MKTKHTAGLIAVVLLFIVGAIAGLAQQGVSSQASEPATLGETNQTLSADRVVVFTEDGLFHILDADQIASVSEL
jgi:hypothetical protein